MLHPIHRCLIAERLTRRRRGSDRARVAQARRTGTIDANPHQVDAVAFALSRVREGGCILADEVGLGKTVEAGLVIAQLRCEGAQRVLLVCPRPLIGQWQQELLSLFGIETREISSQEDCRVEGPGVFLIGRERLGSERVFRRLRASEPFDLCVVDEAHEVFAGIYRRFDRAGNYVEDSEVAQLSGRLKVLLAGSTPTLLLTATPLQNSLAELWGLVQFVDPSGTLFGTLSTFRQVFCADDDRSLRSDQAGDLRERLQRVLRRNLRKHVQDFMKKPFVGRHARLFEYSMSAAERSLYEELATYLQDPRSLAFRGPHRRLLVLGFHRRMASSHAALDASLLKLEERLEALRNSATEPEPDLSDLEEEAEDYSLQAEGTEAAPIDIAQLEHELQQVRAFRARLSQLRTDPKAHALLQAVRFVHARQRQGLGSGKLVIFTESLATQAYLRSLLIEARLLVDEDITLFRGDNRSERSFAALQRYREEVLDPHGDQPGEDVALRLALVHEFRCRSKVFISTEAGARGLNLQFCDTLINYDLPWNPQRIEQRIGRCHRYGQQRDVTVINFLARDNAAQQLTFDILSRKLALFGEVLDASDVVLSQPEPQSVSVAAELSADFAEQLSDIYQRCRTLADIEAELAGLSNRIEERRAYLARAEQRAAGIIDTQFDESVRQAFRGIERALEEKVPELDRDLLALTRDFLDRRGVDYQVQDGKLSIPPSEHLPSELRRGAMVRLGDGSAQEPTSPAPPLSLSHPLVQAALAEAWPPRERFVEARLASPPPADLPEDARAVHMRLLRLHYPGFEPTEHFLPVLVCGAGQRALPAERALELLERLWADAEGSDRPALAVSSLDEAVEEAAFRDEQAVAVEEQRCFERALEQIERFVLDRVLLLRRGRADLVRRLAAAQRQRAAATNSIARERAARDSEQLQQRIDQVDEEIGRLRERDDEDYRRFRKRAYERRYAKVGREVLMEGVLVVQ